MTKLPLLAALMTCCHDRWSRRKWTAFYASIKASQVRACPVVVLTIIASWLVVLAAVNAA